MIEDWTTLISMKTVPVAGILGFKWSMIQKSCARSTTHSPISVAIPTAWDVLGLKCGSRLFSVLAPLVLFGPLGPLGPLAPLAPLA